MATEVKPGQWVNITVVKRPRAAAGVKTLERLFGRTVSARKARERQAKARPITDHRRGGRMWKDRPPHIRVVEIKAGATCKLFASVDVLRDLESVANSVQVSPA